MGEPDFDFKLILRDCPQQVREHDLHNFVEALKSAAETQYKRVRFS
jgi:hypothetical protein